MKPDPEIANYKTSCCFADWHVDNLLTYHCNECGKDITKEIESLIENAK